MANSETGRMSENFGRLSRARVTVLLSYASFVFIGVSLGVGGVLLLAQMRDYGVDRATIGATFLAGSAGFVLSGLSNSVLIQRLGIRMALAVGGGSYILASLYLAARPPFAAFVAVQLLTGYGSGVLSAVLQTYLAALPGAMALLNRLHAFFGVGGLIGPALAAWITGFASWTVVCLVLALACVPLLAGFMAFPRLLPGPAEASGFPSPGPGAPVAEAAGSSSGSVLSTVLRDRGIVYGTVMLAVYVGLELSVGNWGFSYLVQARGLTGTLAGYSVSGYWLGLTAGRFLISPLATRAGVTTTGMVYACLAGSAAAATLVWLLPTAAAASVALALLGFSLGPVFPTTIGIVPRLATPRQAPTAIGVMNTGGTVGGTAFPWLAGVIAQGTGIWALMPFAVLLAVAQLAAWRPLAARIRPRRPSRETGDQVVRNEEAPVSCPPVM